MNNLDEIRDIHKGKKAYVIGSGASLRDIDKNMIKDGISFAVNETALFFDYFDYYVFTDYNVPRTNYYQIAVEKCGTIIFTESAMIGMFDKIDKPKFMFERRLEDPGNYKFEGDKLIVGVDCVHVATHLAWICGCSPIVLLGVDLCWKDEVHCVDWDKITYDNKPLTEEKNKKDFQIQEQNGFKTHKGFRHSVEIWEHINRQNVDLNILNASPISLVPYFEKI